MSTGSVHSLGLYSLDLTNRITFRFKMDGICTDWQVTGKGLENFNASNNAFFSVTEARLLGGSTCS